MTVDLVLAVAAGVGLAAATGLRVFAPLLAVSLAGRFELLRLGEGFEWMASGPAALAFGVATVVEVAGYLVPFVDNLLDAAATPAAAVAGTLVAAAVIADVDPWLRWTLALVAGGGVATAVKVPAAALRAGSSLGTAGTANPAIGATESAGSVTLAGVSVVAPLVVPLALAVLVVLLWRLRPRRPKAGTRP